MTSPGAGRGIGIACSLWRRLGRRPRRARGARVSGRLQGGGNRA
ncbi:MAG: hypothetical protein OXU61_04420 [Gammaproteobacteria bacterium]|nr:hypothetical protein [Gammaproteobacteria bacterium]